MAKILVFGEILWDVFDTERFLAGAPLNFAVHSIKLGTKTAIISSVGNDCLGSDTKRKLQEYDISSRFLQTSDAYATGVTVVTLNNGEPIYDLKENTAYDNIEYSEELQKKIDNYSADCLYFGTVGQRSTVSASTLKNILENSIFTNVFCDLNLREGNFSEKTVYFSLKNCNILKLNRNEVEVIKKMYFDKNNIVSENDFADKLCNKFDNLKLIIITLDSKGSFIYDKSSNEQIYQAAEKCNVISPTGAGDAFCAGFITAFLNNRPLKECAVNATKLATYVLQYKEAIPE